MSGLIRKITLVFLGFAVLSINIVAQAADKNFTPDQKAQINQMIRAYILEHPEILPKAIQILQNRGKRAALEQKHTALYEDGFSHVGGNQNGDITIIEFFDYNW